MTPLAHQIVKQLTLPVKDRTFVDNCGMLKLMADIHCFECNGIFDMAFELSKEMLRKDSGCKQLGFLPAPKTWIEYTAENGTRIGVLLIDRNDGFADVFWAGGNTNGLFISMEEKGQLRLRPSRFEGELFPRVMYGVSDVRDLAAAAILYAMLAIINSPRILGRRQFAPHRGLERDLVKQQPVIGKFPLHAWTEIVLECSPPKDMSHLPGYEAHLTGKKCLHFCRAHLRIKNGRVEFVKAHWRGDGALGIKQSRYVLKPPRSAA